VLTVKTFAAWDVMEHYDSISGLELPDVGTDRSDYTGSLMAEDAWGGMRTCGNFLKIGTAHPAGMNAYQNLSRANRRHGNSLKPNVVHATVNRSLHGRRDGSRFGFNRELSGKRHSRY
jgi:hypothetical protein